MSTADTTEHQRGSDPPEIVREHRRSTDTGVRGWFHRNLNWIAYLILAGAIAFSLNNVRNEGIDRRTEIVTATQNVIFDSCQRGNDTRTLLRGLIAQGQESTQKYLEEGVLNQAQYDRAIAANKEAIQKLANVDCEKAVEAVAERQGNG